MAKKTIDHIESGSLNYRDGNKYYRDIIDYGNQPNQGQVMRDQYLDTHYIKQNDIKTSPKTTREKKKKYKKNKNSSIKKENLNNAFKL